MLQIYNAYNTLFTDYDYDCSFCHLENLTPKTVLMLPPSEYKVSSTKDQQT